MKKNIRFFLSFIVLFLVAFIAFYFWGSSSKFSQAEYSQVQNYELVDYQDPNDSTFTILSYNIGYLSGMTNNLPMTRPKSLYDDNLKKSIDVLKKIDADIVAFQEIDFASQRSFEVNQLDEIAKGVNYNYASMVVNWDKTYVPFPYGLPNRHFGRILSGQAITSHFPIQEHERVLLEAVVNSPFYRTAFYLDRLAEVTQLDINGKDLIVINIHLEAFDKETRLIQSKTVLKLFKKYAKDYPVLLIGDFNSRPEDEEVKNPTIDVFLKDPSLKSAIADADLRADNQKTFPSDKPIEKIDFIFYNQDKIEILDARVVHEIGTASDHLPILANFKFQ